MSEISAADAGTIKLGDFTLNRIGLGTNRISGDEASREILRHAVKRGVNLIDTADKYQSGHSEETIGAVLAPYPPGVAIATKGGWSHDNAPESLEAKISQSLRRLKLDQIPLWQLHRVDVSVPLEDTMRFLKTQLQAGKIRHIGLSEVTAGQIKAARRIAPIASVQNLYNFGDRLHDDVVDYCTREDIIFLPYFPLGSGGLGHDQKLSEIARKYDAEPLQIALAWLLKRSPVMLPIPGTLNKDHLDSNLAAASIKLSDVDFSAM